MATGIGTSTTFDSYGLLAGMALLDQEPRRREIKFGAAAAEDFHVADRADVYAGFHGGNEPCSEPTGTTRSPVTAR